MSYEIKRLCADDMADLAAMLNISFTGDPNSRHFEDGLPKMWVADDEHMSHNIALIEDGEIAAVTGMYPYEVSVAGKVLRFATVGNIAVLPKHRGKGYMQLLVETAMRDLVEQNIDVSRLGGLRSRYEVYGYEPAGTNYTVLLTERNAKEAEAREGGKAVAFTRVAPTDTAALNFIRGLYEQNLIHVKRGSDRDLYATLCAWSHIPYLAVCDGQPIGYLCATKDGTAIAEHKGITAKDNAAMLYQWVLQSPADHVRFAMYPWDHALCGILSRVCEALTADAATHFKVLNWDRMVEAALTLKAAVLPIPDGRLLLGVADYGTLEMVKEGDTVCVNRCEDAADITLDKLTATRFLFGPLPPQLVAELPTEKGCLITAWFPLPMSWNGQDRV